MVQENSAPDNNSRMARKVDCGSEGNYCPETKNIYTTPKNRLHLLNVSDKNVFGKPSHLREINSTSSIRERFQGLGNPWKTYSWEEIYNRCKAINPEKWMDYIDWMGAQFLKDYRVSGILLKNEDDFLVYHCGPLIYFLKEDCFYRFSSRHYMQSESENYLDAKFFQQGLSLKIIDNKSFRYTDIFDCDEVISVDKKFNIKSVQYIDNFYLNHKSSLLPQIMKS